MIPSHWHKSIAVVTLAGMTIVTGMGEVGHHALIHAQSRCCSACYDAAATDQPKSDSLALTGGALRRNASRHVRTHDCALCRVLQHGGLVAWGWSMPKQTLVLYGGEAPCAQLTLDDLRISYYSRGPPSDELS